MVHRENNDNNHESQNDELRDLSSDLMYKIRSRSRQPLLISLTQRSMEPLSKKWMQRI